MCLHIKHFLLFWQIFALLQIINAKLIDTDEEDEQKPIQYGCVNYDMAVELLAKVKLIESRSENMLYKLNSIASDSTVSFGELSLNDHVKITENIKEAVKDLLESQRKSLNSEFSKEHIRAVLETINDSLKNIKQTQRELHGQSKILESKLNTGNSLLGAESVLKNFLQTLQKENEKQAESLQIALSKILEQENTQHLNIMNNQTIDLVAQFGELDNNLNKNLKNLLQNEHKELKDALNEDAKKILKAELDDVKQNVNKQNSKCDGGGIKSELQDFITKSLQSAFKEQQKLISETLQKPAKEENLKFSERYLSSATGICDVKKGLPENCEEALRGNPQCGEGVYLLYVPGYNLEPFFAYCLPDKTTPSMPSWTVIQRRQSGLYNFTRGWNDYRDGFGNVKSTYWLGLKYIHALTSRQNNELWVEMVDWKNVKRFATYEQFVVGSEKNKFPLSVLGNYGGVAGDSLTFHVGQKFTTIDSDNDRRTNGNCAVDFAGGWWYDDCHVSNPNGIYNSSETGRGINWKSWHGYNYSYKYFHLAIRPKKV